MKQGIFNLNKSHVIIVNKVLLHYLNPNILHFNTYYATTFYQQHKVHFKYALYMFH